MSTLIRPRLAGVAASRRRAVSPNKLSATTARMIDPAASFTRTNTNAELPVPATVDGGAVMQLQARIVGGYSAYTTGLVRCSPGDSIRALAEVKAATTARSTYVVVRWLSSNGTTVLSTTTASNVTDSTSGWTALSTVQTAPASTVFCQIQMGIAGATPAAAGEIHYFRNPAVYVNSSETNYVAPDLDYAHQWTWWSRTRAVAVGGRTLIAGVTDKNECFIDEYVGGNRTIRRPLWTHVGIPDDHNNPGMACQVGKPLVVVGFRHNVDKVFHWRKSTVNIEDGISLGLEQTLTLTTPGSITYACVHEHGTNGIFVLFRDSTSSWGYIRSTDWGDTWGTPVTLFSSSFQMYGASVRVGTDTLRIAFTNHPVNGSPPDQNIYYAEINLSTGAITKSDGTGLGNLDGTSLPIALGSLELVATPTTSRVTWCYDVGDGTVPEVVWSEWNNASLATSSTYKISRLVSGSWVTNTIVAAGDRFSDTTEQYLGGVQIPRSTPGQKVYVSRESGGTWYIDRMTSTDGGATWTTVNLASSPTKKLVRAWPVRKLDTTSTFEVVANEILSFTLYSNEDSGMARLGSA